MNLSTNLYEQTEAPVKTLIQEVEASWIDYNGHMNVAYYTLVFDRAIDQFLEETLGVGPSFVKKYKQGPYSLQANYNYMNELCLGDKFFANVYMLDSNEKLMHLMLEMINDDTKIAVATCETLYMNVDLKLRKSTPYPVWAQERMSSFQAACKSKKLPIQVQKAIKIK